MSLPSFALFLLLLSYSSGQPVSQVNEANEPSSPVINLIENDSTTPKYKICAGCPSDALNDENIEKLVKVTLPEFDSRSSHANKYKLKVVKATKQVVAGMKYNIEALLVLTDCSKNDSKDIEFCNELDEPKEEKCEIIIWERAWLPQGRQTDVKCETTNFSFKSEAQ